MIPLLSTVTALLHRAGVRVSFSNDSAYSYSTGTTARAGFRFNPDGTIDRQQQTWSYRRDWCSPTGGSPAPGDSYEIYATLDSGDDPGNTGSWISLSSTVTFALAATPLNDYRECQITVAIRDAATMTTVDSATFTITAEKA